MRPHRRLHQRHQTLAALRARESLQQEIGQDDNFDARQTADVCLTAVDRTDSAARTVTT